MAQSMVDINGDVRDAANLTLPTTGRDFRSAWQFNGNVVEIDMVKARDIKIEKIWEKAQERIKTAEDNAAKKAMKGQDVTAEEAEISKFKAKPKQAAIDLIANAATPEELTAITEDQIYA